MTTLLTELREAARVAESLSTHGLRISLLVEPEGVVVTGRVIEDGGSTSHAYMVEWGDLVVNPALVQRGIRVVERLLRPRRDGLGFVDRPEGGPGRTSIRKSHRAEGWNFVD